MASEAFVIPSRTGSAFAGVAALADDALVLLLEHEAVDECARQEVGVARVEHGDLAHHLARDDLDVLVVDVDALGRVDVLDLGDDVGRDVLLTAKGEQVVRVDGALGELGARLDLDSVRDAGAQARAPRDGVALLVRPSCR